MKVIELAARGVGRTPAASKTQASSADNSTQASTATQPRETARKLPPFGKQVSDGERHLWIYAGSDAWRAKGAICRLIPGRVLLPPGESPSAYRWPVAGRDVLIVVLGDIDDTALLQLAHECLRQGAKVVRVLETTLHLSAHRAEVRHAVA